MPCGEAQVPLSRTSDGGFIIGTKTLLKVDSQGNQQWLRTYDGLTYALSVRQTPDGGYVAAGPSHDSSIYLLKTNANGDRMWKKTYASSEYSSGSWVERTADGGYVMAGTTAPDTWPVASVIKTTADGAPVWTASLLIGDATCVRQTQDGGYIVTGTWGALSYRQDLFLTKLAPERKR